MLYLSEIQQGTVNQKFLRALYFANFATSSKFVKTGREYSIFNK